MLIPAPPQTFNVWRGFKGGFTKNDEWGLQFVASFKFRDNAIAFIEKQLDTEDGSLYAIEQVDAELIQTKEVKPDA